MDTQYSCKGCAFDKPYVDLLYPSNTGWGFQKSKVFSSGLRFIIRKQTT